MQWLTKNLLFIVFALFFLLPASADPFPSLSIPLTEEEKAFLKTHPVIRVHLEKDWYPFNYTEKGKPGGYSNDLITSIAANLGIEISFTGGYNWAEYLEMIENREIDIISNISRTAERDNFLLFTRPVMELTLSFICRTGSPVYSLEELKGRKLIILKGFWYFEKIKNEYPEIEVIYAETESEAFKAVSSGQAYAAIDYKSTADYFSAANNITNLTAASPVLEIGGGNDPIYIGIRKDWPLLVSAFNKALDRIMEYDENRLLNNWFKSRYPETVKQIKLTEEEKIFIRNNPVIKIGTGESFHAFASKNKDGSIEGLLGEIADRTKELTSLEIQIIIDDFNDLEEKAYKREIDGLFPSNRYREEYFNFSDSVTSSLQYVYVKEGNPADIRTEKDLENKRMGLQKNNLKMGSHAEKIKGIIPVYSDNVKGLLKSLVNNEIDFFIWSETLPLTADFYGIPFIEPVLLIDDEYEIVFSLRNDKPELTGIINKVLTVISDRELQDIKEKIKNKLRFKQQRKTWKNSFTESEKKYLENKKIIRMSANPDWFPVEGIDKNGEYAGFGAKIFKLLEERSGLVFEFVPTQNWEETLKNAEERKCDIITMASPTPDRSEYLAFTHPYVSLPLVIVTGTEQLFVPNFSTLSGKKVGLIKDSAYHEILKKRYPSIKIFPVKTILEGMKMLNRGDLFGYIDSFPTAAHAIQIHGFNKLKIGGKFDITWDLSVAVRSDEPILKDIMEKALSTLSEAEKLNEYNMWYSVELEEKVDYSAIWKILLFSSAVLIIVLLWNRSLLKSRTDARKALESLKKVQLKLEEQNSYLEKFAETDKLTGLYNRFRLDEVLERETERSRRYNNTLALILLDMDKFKLVNDTFGHQEGDRLLIQTAEILLRKSRKSDTVGRWGGEEFLIVCPMSDREAVISHAEKIRKAVEENPLPEIGKTTVSCGTAVFRSGDTVDSLVSRADKALYLAKANGRNCVEYL